MTEHFAARLRAKERIVGYWVTTDNAPATERIASTGYDYVCLDLQHGFIDYQAAVHNLMALELGGAAGVIRVPVGDAWWIGRALDAGARAVIVPMVESREQATAAVAACRYPPVGVRSYGPMRSSLRIGPAPREADDEVACIAMIETIDGLAKADAICSTPGLDAIYVGPSDLSLAIGGETPAHGWSLPAYPEAIDTILGAAARAGIAVGLHVNDGAAGAAAFERGFDFVSISNDLNHILAFTRAELEAARGTGRS